MVVEVVPYAEAEVAVVDYDMTDIHHMSCMSSPQKSLPFRILRWSSDVRSAEHVSSFKTLH